ncbi:substrate-binding periplasmic protein [Pseudoduganella aquatica]|uniref:Transporter substrate-binding domain-containing protein n=1 Tax=Pseudoduganella aquatica TaxID=2660641 RepID=A0A7X4HGL9_9BURK|nr:transporter substrate-binding domain-containing protein [Pseudoduganella aquatica]MYN10908.1 transporter substrate-binding domain-containing protein [Pseudoduganella aquatica]
MPPSWPDPARLAARCRVALAALVCLAGPAHAGPLVLRTAAQDNNTLKYELRAKRKGICVDVIKALERTDPALHFSGWTQPMSLPRIESALAEGQLDAFCALIRTSAREARFGFIDIPVYTVRHTIAVRADDQVVVNSLDDIRKLGPDNVIIVSKGTAHESKLQHEKGLRVDATSRDTDVNLRKLLNKRGRFYYHTESALRRYIADEQLKGMIRLLPTVFSEETLYFAVSPSLPPPATEQLRQALRKLAERGELQKIYASYKED